jgi:hypothetical protein
MQRRVSAPSYIKESLNLKESETDVVVYECFAKAVTKLFLVKRNNRLTEKFLNSNPILQVSVLNTIYLDIPAYLQPM